MERLCSSICPCAAASPPSPPPASRFFFSSSFFSSILIASQLRLTSAEVSAFTSPNTCGWRLMSLVDSRSSTSSIEKEACSFAIGIEQNLQQQVAEFARQFSPIAIVDGLEDFVGLFERVGLDGIKGLFAVPGASARSAQTLHNCDRSLETFSRGRHAATNVNDGRARR